MVNALRYLLDTNAIIYLHSNRLTAPLPVGDYSISVIAKMELLSYPNLTAEQEQRLAEFFEAVKIIQLQPDIQAEAIVLRKKYRLRLPDAIIAASAKIEDSILLTADADFEKISEIRIQKIVIR